MTTRILIRFAAALALTLSAGAHLAHGQFIPAQPVRVTPAPAGNEAARDALRDALDADPRVPSEQVAILVMAEHVTLFGTVPDEETRLAAVRIARETAPMRRIRDRLDVGDEDAADETSSEQARSGRETARTTVALQTQTR